MQERGDEMLYPYLLSVGILKRLKYIFETLLDKQGLNKYPSKCTIKKTDEVLNNWLLKQGF